MNNKREINALVNQMAYLQNFIESNNFTELLAKIAEIEQFLKRFGKLDDLIAHLQEMEQRIYIIKDYMNMEEASQYLQISKGTLYKLTANNGIKFYKPKGKYIFFKREELNEWIEQYCCLPDSTSSLKAKRLFSSKPIKIVNNNHLNKNKSYE